MRDFFYATSKLKIPALYRCDVKFRKLKQYRASGIYFSHTKTLGLDFRDGMWSYIHEIAHHIDINGYRKAREKMIIYL